MEGRIPLPTFFPKMESKNWGPTSAVLSARSTSAAKVADRGHPFGVWGPMRALPV